VTVARCRTRDAYHIPGNKTDAAQIDGECGERERAEGQAQLGIDAERVRDSRPFGNAIDGAQRDVQTLGRLTVRRRAYRVREHNREAER
jgi:hypothetical protein